VPRTLSHALVQPLALATILGAFLVLGAGPGAAQASSLFSDNFNSITNGQSDPAWTSWNSSNWVVNNGTYNASSISGAGSAFATVTGLELTDFVMDFDISSGDGGAFLRRHDNGVHNDFYVLVIRGGDAYWHIHQNDIYNGFYDYHTFSMPLARHVTLTASGSTYTAVITDLSNAANSVTLSLTDAQFPQGEVGFYSNDGGEQIDNVVVTPEPATLSLLALGGLLAWRRRR
jgi:hypothetical protein